MVAVKCSLDERNTAYSAGGVMTVACHFSRLLAIMGPSGGGKTSLLNALAGQVPETKGALPYAAFQRHPNAQPWMTISWRVAPRIESGLHVDHD